MSGNDSTYIVDTGDKRFAEVLRRLTADGFKAEAYDAGRDYLGRADAVFLFSPSPALPAALPDGATVFSYNPGEDMSKRFPSAKARFLNYLDDENLAAANARYTAEGALALMISGTGKSMRKTRVAVFGGGRVGKAVLRILVQNGIYCALASRDELERKYARLLGVRVYGIDQINDRLETFDCVINSIPSLIFNGGRLDLLPKHCYLLDLASKPGGTDFEYAEKIGIRAENALGLPGKFCPLSAADDLCSSVLARV